MTWMIWGTPILENLPYCAWCLSTLDRVVDLQDSLKELRVYLGSKCCQEEVQHKFEPATRRGTWNHVDWTLDILIHWSYDNFIKLSPSFEKSPVKFRFASCSSCWMARISRMASRAVGERCFHGQALGAGTPCSISDALLDEHRPNMLRDVVVGK